MLIRSVDELDTLALVELVFWGLALLVAGFLLWRVRKQDRDLPRLPILIIAGLFLLGHFFFDSLGDFLEQPAPRDLLTFEFLARVGIEALETAGFLFLILISLNVAEARRTIRKQRLELTEANKQLLQASKLASVGELASGLAHEINNPIGIILARTDYLLSIAGKDTLDELREGLRVVCRQAERVSETVRGLLTFARPSAVSKQQVKIEEVVAEALQLEAPRCHAREIEIKRDFARAMPVVQADAGRLRQVFINILNNAIDAMPQGGRLTVVTGKDDGRAAFVSFSDTGVGIPEENILKVFDPFFTTKPPGKGTGLGLAVSYGIIHEHGGEIRVESSAGEGSTFTVILPFEANLR